MIQIIPFSVSRQYLKSIFAKDFIYLLRTDTGSGESVKKILLLLFVLTQLVACSAEVGSAEWCEELDQKPKGDWSVNEAADYTKHCIF